MNLLQEQLKRAADAFGLRCEIPFEFKTALGTAILADAMLTGPDALSPMLIFSTDEAVRKWEAEMSEAGFGFSVLSLPRLTEPFQLSGFGSMFREWGLFGDEDSTEESE